MVLILVKMKLMTMLVFIAFPSLLVMFCVGGGG